MHVSEMSTRARPIDGEEQKMRLIHEMDLKFSSCQTQDEIISVFRSYGYVSDHCLRIFLKYFTDRAFERIAEKNPEVMNFKAMWEATKEYESGANQRADAAQKLAVDALMKKWRAESETKAIKQKEAKRLARKRAAENGQTPMDVEDVQRQMRMQKLKERQKKAEIFAKKSREKQARIAEIKAKPPVKLPRKEGWWKQMYEGQITPKGSIFIMGFQGGENYIQLPKETWKTYDAISKRKGKNKYTYELRF